MSTDLIANIQDSITNAKTYNRTTLFTVATTSKQEINPYVTPLRVYENYCILGCVIFSQDIILEVIETIDGVVDLLLVDSEKKIPLSLMADNSEALYKGDTIGNFETGNLSKICFKYTKKTKVFEYKPNDLTVCAAWNFLSQRLGFFTGKKVAILGLGNIGAKLALKLVESGADVHVFSKDYFKSHSIAQALNLIKPVGTLASISVHREALPASFMAHVLIGATNGIPIIDDAIVKSVRTNCLILDIGKNNLEKTALDLARSKSLEICRTDVTTSLEGFVCEMLSLNHNISYAYGRRVIEGIGIVGGGYFGEPGDVIVDNISCPKIIYGVADGMGSVKRIHSKIDLNKLIALRKELGLEI
ncbi:hypothetical protein OAL38_00635 [bacterium]|nr:hypothetical protein [bacterium]